MTEDEWIEQTLAKLPPMTDRVRAELAAMIGTPTPPAATQAA